jgi:hypothetical protein
LPRCLLHTSSLRWSRDRAGHLAGGWWLVAGGWWLVAGKLQTTTY